MPLSIVSYNVNGFRSVVEKGLLDWIDENQFDFVCLQETKSNPSRVPSLLLQQMGYHHVWHHAQKRGYSGVATFSKSSPIKTHLGLGIEKYDVEGRVLRTDFEGFTLLNCYFPNGASSDERHQFKMRFLDDFYAFTENFLERRESLIVVGDFNIAHQDIDIHDPSRHRGRSGFRPQEREWMSEWLELGLVDAFRQLYPAKQEFSFWRFNVGTKESNKGWRLDYQSVSDNLISQIVDVRHLKELDFSDHCPVLMEIDL